MDIGQSAYSIKTVSSTIILLPLRMDSHAQNFLTRAQSLLKTSAASNMLSTFISLRQSSFMLAPCSLVVGMHVEPIANPTKCFGEHKDNLCNIADNVLLLMCPLFIGFTVLQ